MKCKLKFSEEAVNIDSIQIEDFVKKQKVFYFCDCGRKGETSLSRFLSFPEGERKKCFICRQNKSREEKYGDPHFRNVKKAKQTKKEKYGNENYINLEKMKKTCIEKFGVESPFKSKEIQEKIKESLFRKFGVEHPAQSEIIKDKMKNTCLKKFGVENPAQNNEIKNKERESRLKHFGSYAPPDFGEKIKTTKKERYGRENYNNEEKRKSTCLKKWGVESHMQVPEIAARNRKKIFYAGNYWDSSWEIAYFEYCKSMGRNIRKNKQKVFFYTFEGKKHAYYPDFEEDGVFVEIKGDHFFENGKMINPFDRTQDGIYEAKHQCMLKNNVKILTSKDLKDVFDWVKSKAQLKNFDFAL